jgi:hypothetical protein
MSTPKPTLISYSPGHSTGYIVTAADYNNDTLQQGAWTQLMLGAATAFPASPNTSDTCFRSDLGAWFRYDGAAWQQMGTATFTTANRPAAPPTDYRYYDLTTKAVYRWMGSAYTDNMGLPAWTVVSAFTNTWVDASAFSAMQTTRYRIDSFGNVTLIGSVKSGTIGQAAFNLPAGYRPPTILYLLGVDLNTNLAVRVDVQTGGNVVVSTGGNTFATTFNLVFPTV